jgi:hypothetical protein
LKKAFRQIILTLWCLCILNYIGNAQSWAWAETAPMSSYGITEGYGCTLDNMGNIYTTGYFNSPTIIFGTKTLTIVGTGDNSFLIKYDPSGNVLWAKSGISSAMIDPYSVSTDASGNAFITGSFSGLNAIFGSYTLTNTGGDDSFLVKYDPNGNVLWAKIIAGTNGDYANSVSTDINGNSFITGQFASPTLSLNTTSLYNTAGGVAMFVAKYDMNGNVLWAKSAGGVINDSPNWIATDPSGNALITGYFSSPSLTLDSYTLTNTGVRDIFVAKYNPSGNVVWAKSFGGANGDGAYGITVDGSGNSYITGEIGSAVAFGSYTVNNIGSYNAFVSKHDPNGNTLWAQGIGGSGNDNGHTVSCYSGGVYVTGYLSSPSLTFGTYTVTPPPGSYDPMFIAQYDLNGNVVCATSLSSGADDNNGICVDNFGNAYITGDFVTSPFIIGTNTLTTTGSESFFITKFNCQADVGIKFIGEDLMIKIFPNPNNGSFYIELNSPAQLIITNTLGEEILNQTFSLGKQNVNICQSSGIYFYKLIGEKTISGKLIKQ